VISVVVLIQWNQVALFVWPDLFSFISMNNGLFNCSQFRRLVDVGESDSTIPSNPIEGTFKLYVLVILEGNVQSIHGSDLYGVKVRVTC